MLFIVLFLALSGGLVYWQVIVSKQVASNPHNNRACLYENAPLRGRIFDRNGVLLADSQPNQDARCGYMRHYYEPSLAGLIGYYAGPNYPSTGLEHQFDAYLTGQVGATELENQMNHLLHQSPVGNDLYLTIDVRIQRIVNQHFDDPVQIVDNSTFKTDRGSVIVTNPQTGEILAMLSRPGYDPNRMVQTLVKGNLSYYNQLANDPIGKPLRWRPTQETYAPGSVYKTVTLMAGLNEGKTTLDQSFDQQHALGPIFYNGQQIGPVGNNIGGYTSKFPVTTEYGFTHSDNVIFAQIGVNTGSDKWLAFNKKFYIGEQIPFDLPVTPSTVLPAGTQTLADNQLAANAFGQGYNSITPFQMSLFDNAAAANGKLMHPMLVAKITNHDGSALQTFTPEQLSAPLSEKAATDTRKAMYGVTYCGSGSIERVRINGSPWGIISKTGTAQVSDNESIPAQSWLITQAPYSVNNPSQLPALTIVAMKENGGEGGAQNGPMLTAMYNDIFTKIDTYKGLKAPGPAAPTYCCSAKLLQIGC
ncbi:penicillin-binding transpeptidase domain-containing protein [Tengunoibacter tsumagoiensis]|uniref:penicillin-binding transpeptidase domain-containing protein n=1 Tax=Tengunoibacter tsumagoiensis TaxID=2014871 RepID=UPI001FEBB2EC|nr:penicillin-binding transpeptidase domain-containing protein [Tengunoibacter tsumagoiensis]